MTVSKEVICFCFFGILAHAHAIFSPPASPVQIYIEPVPDYLCAGTLQTFRASISNVEGPAEARISAGSASAVSHGMGGASVSLDVAACESGTLTVYYSFGEHGNFSSNVTIISLAGVEVTSAAPLCAPSAELIHYRAYPTDAAGYSLCPPSWGGPSVKVDPEDPWHATAHCDRGGYYYAHASLGSDPPCQIVKVSPEVMACEVHLLQAFEQDYDRPQLFPNVCLNAQPVYRSARYRVEVLPDDTEAELSLADGSVEVVLSTRTVRNRDTFYVQAEETPGTYRIRLNHSACSGCDDVAEGEVFKFQTTVVKEESPGPNTTRGIGIALPASSLISASTPDANPAGHGAILTSGYSIRVETLPTNVFSGNVRTHLKVTHTLDPHATIFKNAAANQWTLGISASFGIVRVNVTGGGVHSLATASFNAEVQLGNSTPVNAGSFTYSSADFSVPLLSATRDFGIPVVQQIEDVHRVIAVGGPGLPVRATIGVLCVRRDGTGTATVRAARARGNLEVRQPRDEYEIVP